jgi:hypothetical protein
MAVGVRQARAHQARFRVAYALLIGCVVVAALVLGYELTPSSAPPAQARWSAWSPSLPGVAAVLDIANHVGAEYRIKGQQLSRVKAGYPGTTGVIDPSAPAEIRIPVSTIALAITDAKTGLTTYQVIPAYPDTIEYQLCGSGRHCEIPTVHGRTSAQANSALRREALELALYTFHYVPDINRVVELLPPDTRRGPGRALLFDRLVLGPFLAQPLTATLPSRVSTAQQQLVNSITAPALAYAYQQQFDGTYQMVLSVPQ